MKEQMNVPTLRFSEFDGLWSQNKTPIKILAGNAYKQQEYTDNGYLLIQGLHIQPDKIELEESPKYVAVDGSKHLKIGFGDIVLGLNRPITNNQLKACRFYLKEESVLYQRAGKLKFDTAKLGTEFLYQYLRTPVFMKQLDLELIGSDQPYIKSDLFQATKNIFPTIVEQQKIATFLSKVDEKIALLTEKKDKLTEYKKGVMQQLFNGKWEEQDGQLTFIPPTLRFKADDGSEFPDWEEIELGKLSKKSTVKNKDNSVSVVLTNSATQGIISQADYFDRDIANQSNLDGYYVVNPDDFVYNPRISIPAPVGPINRNKIDVGVMSPLYTVFSVKKGLNLSYLEYFFKTTNWHRYMNSIANFGARHDRMNITTSDFFKMPIPVPCIAEQNKIVHFVSSIDQKIDLANSELDKTKEWKKGLLQQMFV
ncbi:TPA: restriction endonuclease subunit S [Vibrio parahaemolyticus]|nr:restriction endonuclease subunit S [Vibrio parahaemolyticus]